MYRAVADRVAVDLTHLDVPLTPQETRKLLESKGFTFRFLQIVPDLRRQKGISVYKQRALLRQAPALADCSSLVQWAFGQSGIEIPRLSIEQREFGRRIDFDHLRPLDLVFTSSEKHNYYLTDKRDGVGHVGVFTSQRTVLHLTRDGLQEEGISELLVRREFRGAARIVHNPLSTVVLETPDNIDIHSDASVKWFILSQQPVASDRACADAAV